MIFFFKIINTIKWRPHKSHADFPLTENRIELTENLHYNQNQITKPEFQKLKIHNQNQS